MAIDFRTFILPKIDEAAGSLAGLPKSFVNQIVKNYSGGLGGENSKIELFKKDAKQKDVTAAAKMTGGYVAPADRASTWARSSTPAEKQAELNRKFYAGVMIKVDGEWAFMVSYEDHAARGGGSFQLTASDGTSAEVKRTDNIKVPMAKLRRVGGPRYNYHEFNSKYIKAGEISDFIDFEESEVDVYLITADQERLAKQAERKAEKDGTRAPAPEKQAALIKFLDQKSSGLITAYDKILQDSVKKISDAVSDVFKQASQGKYVGRGTIEGSITELQNQFKDASQIAYYISDIVKNGKIKETDHNGITKDSWAYGNFKEIADKINSSTED